MKVEDIFLAFWAIFSSPKRENINRDIGILFEKDIKEYAEKMNFLFAEAKTEQYGHANLIRQYPELNESAFSRFTFIKACMTTFINDILDTDFIQYISSGRTSTIRLKKASHIAEDVYERLQFLKDFHFVPQEENASLEQ